MRHSNVYDLCTAEAPRRRRRDVPILTVYVCNVCSAVDVLTQTYKHIAIYRIGWWKSGVVGSDDGGVTMVIWNIWYVGRALVGYFSVYWFWSTRVYTVCVSNSRVR